MKRYSPEVRSALHKAADLIEKQASEIASLKGHIEKLARVEESRGLLDTMARKGLRAKDAISEEDIRKLAESDRNLEQMGELLEHIPVQDDLWTQSDLPLGGESAASRRDAWIFEGAVD